MTREPPTAQARIKRSHRPRPIGIDHRWPAQLQPGESRAVVSALDILPTALAAAGLSAPQDKPLDGLNLLSILRGVAP